MPALEGLGDDGVVSAQVRPAREAHIYAGSLHILKEQAAHESPVAPTEARAASVGHASPAHAREGARGGAGTAARAWGAGGAGARRSSSDPGEGPGRFRASGQNG